MVVIVMGVAGSGKSTIGRALAASLGWEFHDGDDLHSEASKEKMCAGEPLTDLDRAPWLRAVRALIQSMLSSGRSGVVACSALKEAYREEIVVEPGVVKIVYLKGAKELIAERLAGRRGHFMSPALLQSQLGYAGGAARCDRGGYIDGSWSDRGCDHSWAWQAI